MTEARTHRRRHGILLALASAALLAAPAWADLDGHGPDAWRVTGVAANDVLNVRMGPDTSYPVIATFAANERGLQQVTCVPLVPQAAWLQMTQAQRNALPQAWCLMRSADLSRSGWVAQRYLGEDVAAAGTEAPAQPPSSTPAAITAAAVTSDNDSGCKAPTLSRGTARTSAKLWEQLQEDSDRFTDVPGYQSLNVGPGSEHIDWDAVYTRERFPESGQSALLPDESMGAVARAMLVFDAVEGVIPHPRYHITYHLKQVWDDCDIIPRAYVQVTRYNLGGARYQEVTQHVDQNQRPPKDIFGPGPHISWRLAMGMVQGKYADIFQASRRVLDDASAAAADCLGLPCLAPEDAKGPQGDWQSVQPSGLPAPVYREPGYKWTPGPVRMAEMLYTQATGSYQYIEASESTSFERPDMTLIISRDVDGQDGHTHGLLQWQGLMDDEISQTWLRVRATPQTEPQWEALDVKWPERADPQPASATPAPSKAPPTADTGLPLELTGDALVDDATRLVANLYHAFAHTRTATDNPFGPEQAGDYFFADLVPRLSGHGADLLYDAQDFDGEILRIGPDPEQPMLRGTIWIEVDYRNFGQDKQAVFWLRADTDRPRTANPDAPAPFRIFRIGQDSGEFPPPQ